MQRSLYRHLAIHACSLALASAFPSTAFAAELGDVMVRSHIGQQLSADIELVMLTVDDAAGVQVKLAAPDVYQGANTRMHPALSSMRMSVVKRDNRQFLHLTTFQPVDAEILHLFLELGTGSRASVRSATLWLTPEPAPVAKPGPARLLPPEPASAVADMMAADAALAAQSAQSVRHAGSAQNAPSGQSAQSGPSAGSAGSADSRAVALRAARMRAAAQNALAAKEPAGVPAVAAPAVAAPPPVKPGPAAVPIKLGGEAVVKRALPGGAKAACTPGQSSSEAQQCLALDQTNTELKTKLVDLEGKVKQLQAALGQGASVAPGASPGSAPPSAAPATAQPPAVTPAKAPAKKKKEASGINATTLIVGGGLLLALVLGLLVYFIRKKKFKFSTAPLKVWQGWRKDKKPAAAEAPPAAEPILSNE